MFGKNKKKEVDLEELRNEQNYQYSNQPNYSQQNQYNNDFYQNQNYNNSYLNQQQYQQNVAYDNLNNQETKPERKKVKKAKSEEDKFKSKLMKRYFLRAILICLNILLIGYFVYEVTILIKSEINKQNLKKEAYIPLCSQSKKKSEELYSKYELDGYHSVKDYSLIGSSLFLSNNRVDAENLSSFSTLQLSNVCSSVDKVAFVDSLRYDIKENDFNSGINLSSLALTSGDYLVYNRTETGSYPLKIEDTNLSVSYYTLPNEEGERNKITLLNTTISKALVIRVEKVSSIMNDYYDLVVASTKQNIEIPNPLKQYKIKVIYSESIDELIKESSLINSPRAVLIDEQDKKIKSGYNSNNTLISNGYVDSTKIETGKLSGYDSDDFIREMSGYIQNAGSCYLYDNHNTCSFKANQVGHVGKTAYHINSNLDLETEFKNILF